MNLALRPTLLAFSQFVRTPTLGRRVAAMMVPAFASTLAFDPAVRIRIRRMAGFNDPPAMLNADGARDGRKVLAWGLRSVIEFDKALKRARA